MRKKIYSDFIPVTESKNCQHLKNNLMFSYADDNERDDVTALAFFQGFLPECQENDSLTPSNVGSKALFAQGQYPSPDCPICTLKGT